MSEPTEPNLPLKDACLFSLFYLKLAMAGDMESVDLIAQLIERYSAIEWDTPQFIANTKAMQCADSVAPPAISQTELYRALVHAQGEMLAERDETISALSASLGNSVDFIKNGTLNIRKRQKFTYELLEFIHKLLAVDRAMRDQLELLGADTSAYVFPEIPEPLNIE